MERFETLAFTSKKIQLLIEEIVSILKKYIKQPFKIYLFGSFARKETSKFSDIDLAVETTKTISHTKISKYSFRKTDRYYS